MHAPNVSKRFEEVSAIVNDREECTVAVTSNKYATFRKIRSGPLRVNFYQNSEPTYLAKGVKNVLSGITSTGYTI